MNRIVSSLPGRIRVRDKRLRHRARLELLELDLSKLPAVTELQTNAGAGSIVVNFDAEQVDPATLENQVDAAVDKALDAPLDKPVRSMTMRVNRYAKVGMLSSLTTSLALAAVGRKRGHAIAGGVFIACLGVHLTTHNKSLLR